MKQYSTVTVQLQRNAVVSNGFGVHAAAVMLLADVDWPKQTGQIV